MTVVYLYHVSSGFVELISSLTELFVLLAVHGIQRNLLQYHDSKLSIFTLTLCQCFRLVASKQPSSSDNPFSVKSCLTLSIQLRFSLPLLLLGTLIYNTFSPSYSTSLLITRPYHLTLLYFLGYSSHFCCPLIILFLTFNMS